MDQSPVCVVYKGVKALVRPLPEHYGGGGLVMEEE